MGIACSSLPLYNGDCSPGAGVRLTEVLTEVISNVSCCRMPKRKCISLYSTVVSILYPSPDKRCKAWNRGILNMGKDRVWCGTNGVVK